MTSNRIAVIFIILVVLWVTGFLPLTMFFRMFAR